jgi:hypothetical protein
VLAQHVQSTLDDSAEALLLKIALHLVRREGLCGFEDPLQGAELKRGCLQLSADPSPHPLTSGAALKFAGPHYDLVRPVTCGAIWLASAAWCTARGPMLRRNEVARLTARYSGYHTCRHRQFEMTKTECQSFKISEPAFTPLPYHCS